jgi:hydroxypyruvate isomerase
MNTNMNKMTRRSALKKVVGSAALMGAAAMNPFSALSDDSRARLKGNIRHSVSAWCYGGVGLETLCRFCKEIGVESVELLDPSQFDTVKKYGLTCAVCNGPSSITNGWNQVENHEKYLKEFEEAIQVVAKYGFPNIITFSGNRRGMSDEEGLENCVKGLKKLAPIAEKYKVTVIMELLNSQGHKDYMCDHTSWGVEMCKQVGSERIKLLYDIYHMQIMEGDIINTINRNHEYFAHYHTGGNPGRNEIDDSQELNYPPIMKAIVKTGFKGFVGQEFVPTNPLPLRSLAQAIQICDV